MAISNKWAIQKVFDIQLFDIVTGANKAIVEDLKQNTFTNAGQTVYAQGESKIVGFDHSKEAKMTAQSGTFSNELMAIQSGATIKEGTNTNIVYTDVITINSNKGKTKFTALGAVGSEIKFAYIKNVDGTLGKRFIQAGAAAEGKFAYAVGTKDITFNLAEVPDGTEIVVFYNVTGGASTKTISNYTDVFSGNVKMVANGVVRDTHSGYDYACQIIFDKAKVLTGFEIATTANGEPAVHGLEIEALEPSKNKKLWELIVFDEGELS